MVEIPLHPRSQHKAKKLTDEEQEKRNRRLESSALTKPFVKKKKDECYTAKRFTDLQKEFQGAVRLIHPATLYPVRPALRQLLKEEEDRRLANEVQVFSEIKKSCGDAVQYFPLWASIFRILTFLDFLPVGSKPSLETVVRYIHTENLLIKQLSLIKTDLFVLPQRLEGDHPYTFKELKDKGLIESFVMEIANIKYGNQLSAFLVPDGLPDDLTDATSNWTWTTFLDWRKEQINCTRPDYQAKMFSLTRYYPIGAMEAARSLRNALSPILRILSEQIAVGNQLKPDFEKMFEELSAKLTTPARDKKGDTCTHSADFSSVVWYGEKYTFNATQADCIRLLWAEWEKGGLGLREWTIAKKIDSENEKFRLSHVFRGKGGKGMHPAWREMIHPQGNGSHCLGTLPEKT